ncbi:MAG: sporulation protein YqfC [Syntrophomonadaceae bacterium]|jgi:sporulation protein YqfC|nr:sporulation protein YqfC [Syntrophomonadaceae bacterium]
MSGGKKEIISQALGDLLEVPRDVALDLARVTIIGRNEILIENHRGVMEYGLRRIRISLSRGYMEIVGEGLELKALMSEEIKIIGMINVVEYIE